METTLTPSEVKTFTSRFNELLEHVRLFGIPRDRKHFVIDKMMFYRLNSIKNRPELLSIAQKLDKQGILF